MLKRFIETYVRYNLASFPAVALLGARQIGKTTLAKSVADTENALYLDLESPEDLMKLQDPVHFLTMHRGKLIILDEIQHHPDLFMILRGIIDNNRQAGIQSGQYLLLGSASMNLLQQSSESLAGRISFVDMFGLNVFEIPNTRENIIQLWIRGGFPDSYLAKSDQQSMLWLENLIRTYVERDIPQMGYKIPAIRLRNLWTMLAHLQGETINYSKLAGNLEVDSKTIRHYIDILVDLLLVRRVQPWHSNTKKRLVKSPRYYVRDTGILHRLLGINSYDALISTPILGKSWEGFVIESIHSVLPIFAETYFYRTAVGAEIDLVIKFSAFEIWAVEIKHGTAPKLNKHFNATCADVGATHKYVVYSGTDIFLIKDGIIMISLMNIMQKIKALSEQNNNITP